MPAVEVDFGGVDVSAYIKSFAATRYWKNKMAYAKIEVSDTVSGAVSIDSNTTVEIWRNLSGGSITDPDDKIFSGYIETHETTKGTITIEAYDELVLCKRAILNKVYLDSDPEAGKISEIFIDIVEDQVTGLTVDSDDSGTTILLDRFRCLRVDALERLRALGEAINWQFYFEPVADDVIFEAEGYTTNTNTLTVGDEIAGGLSWSTDKSELANSITIYGGKQLVRTQESFTGDGGTTDWNLTRKPESLSVTLNGTYQTVAVAGTASAQVYVDYETKEISFAAAPGIGDAIVVNYDYTNPIIIRRMDSASITSYGVHEKIMSYKDISTLDDAIARADKLLDVYATPFVSTKLKLNCTAISGYGITAGQQVHIVDSANSIDDYYLIMDYTYRYPLGYDECTIGDREVRFSEVQFDMLERIKRLEEADLSDQDLAIELVQMSQNFSMEATQMQVSLSLANDTFLVGNTTHGITGTSVIVDSFDSTSANWSSSDFTLADEGSTKQVGAGSMKITMGVNTTGTFTSTTSLGNYSAHTGQNSGAPTQGIVGVWLYKPSGSEITSIKLRIGSGASDYTEITGIRFAEHVSMTIVDWQDDAWNYVIFDLDGGTAATTGTPDWTAVDYRRVELTVDVAGTFYMDHMGITQNSVAPCFLGDRRTESVVETLTY